jgi:hypothetical protein
VINMRALCTLDNLVTTGGWGWGTFHVILQSKH